jgi:hypothetical protein
MCRASIWLDALTAYFLIIAYTTKGNHALFSVHFFVLILSLPTTEICRTPSGGERIWIRGAVVRWCGGAEL